MLLPGQRKFLRVTLEHKPEGKKQVQMLWFEFSTQTQMLVCIPLKSCVDFFFFCENGI